MDFDPCVFSPRFSFICNRHPCSAPRRPPADILVGLRYAGNPTGQPSWLTSRSDPASIPSLWGCRAAPCCRCRVLWPLSSLLHRTSTSVFLPAAARSSAACAFRGHLAHLRDPSLLRSSLQRPCSFKLPCSGLPCPSLLGVNVHRRWPWAVPRTVRTVHARSRSWLRRPRPLRA